MKKISRCLGSLYNPFADYKKSITGHFKRTISFFSLNQTNYSKTLLLTLLISCGLQSCVFVVGAAAGAAAIAIVYDHRTISNALKDTRIANRVSRKIDGLIIGRRDDSHIEVTVFNRVVLLTGEVLSLQLKQKAGNLAQNTAEVDRVYNQIDIKGPTSTLTRTSDTWITTKIKGLMLANEDLKSSSIKVVTEDGVVYLMGLVSPEQAQIAVDIARRTAGVQKVIRIFQYEGVVSAPPPASTPGMNLN